MSGVIRSLPLSERGAIRQEEIWRLAAYLGPQKSAELVQRVVGEIMNRLTTIEMKLLAEEFAEAAQVARGLVPVARQVGLMTVEGVAADLATCCRRGDLHAAHAVMARMMRIAPGAMTAALDAAHAPS